MALSNRRSRQEFEEMSGGKIFRKPNGVVDYFDQITIGLYSFDASIRVREKRGDPSAIHCGRIVCFELLHEGELVAYFDDGQWYITPDEAPFSDDEFAESVRIARDILIQKWSNPEKIDMKTVKTDLF